jgi:hypothetical protein
MSGHGRLRDRKGVGAGRWAAMVVLGPRPVRRARGLLWQWRQQRRDPFGE